MDPRQTDRTTGSASSESVVWIDHEQARIIASTRDGVETVRILDREAAETEAAFEVRATDAVIDADRVVVAGPPDVRTGFERAYVAITHRPDRLVDVEPARRPVRRAGRRP